MHIYILYAHPAETSFCRSVLGAFTLGLREAGHTFEIGDLYQAGFPSEMDAGQYAREVGRDPEAPVPADVRAEQEKMDRAQGLAFIYPLWWSECPAKLKGWFDRVWTYGYAYYYDPQEERRTRISIEKALVLCSSGHTAQHLEELGIAEAMRRIMLEDRLRGIGIREARLEVLGGMMPGDDTCRDANLRKARELASWF